MSPTRLFIAAIIFCGVTGFTVLPAQAETLRQQLDEAVQDYQFQDFGEAEAKFRAVLQKAPANVTAHYYLGAILLQQGKAAEAVPHLERVAASPAGYSGINGQLARAYMQAGRSDKALSLLEGLHRGEPGNEGYAFDYARALQADEQYNDAAELYQRLIDNGGSYAEPARYQLSQIYVKTGAYASAVAELQSVDPNSPYHTAASQYLKALEPFNRPFNLFFSADYFYSDNPTSVSAVLTGTAQPKQGSQGFTLTGMVSSRNLEMTPKLRAKLSYLFYGNFYQNAVARSSDFYGHFLNPSLSYHPTKEYDLLLRGELQSFRFNRQKLSNNYGATLSGAWKTKRFPLFDSALKLHTGYMAKRYTSSYTDAATVISLKYLDGNIWSVGAGGAMTLKKWKGSLALDYTFNDDRPTETGTPGLAAKASDNRSREHLLRADLTVPFGGVLERASLLDRLGLLVGYSFSNKFYLNPQSGTLYADVAGQKINVRLHTVNARLQANLWKKDMLKASLGFEYSNSNSQTATLTYVARKYYGRISLFY